MRKKIQATEEYREVQAIQRASKAVTRLRSKVDPGKIPLINHLKWSAEVLDELARLLQERLDIASGVVSPKPRAGRNARNHVTQLNARRRDAS